MPLTPSLCQQTITNVCIRRGSLYLLLGAGACNPWANLPCRHIIMAGQTVLEVPKLRQRNVAKHRPDPEKASEGYAEPDGSQTSSSNPPHLGSNESNELECEFSRFLLEPPPSIGEERRTRSQTLFTTPLEPDDMAENQVMNESSRGRFRSRVKQKGPRAQSSDTLLENVVVPVGRLFPFPAPLFPSVLPHPFSDRMEPPLRNNHVPSFRPL